MRTTRRTGVLAIAAALALTAGGVTVLPASAGETVKIDGGTLTFEGATNKISYDGNEYSGSDQDLTTTTLLPAVGAANCDLNAPTEGPLLALTGYLGVPSPSSTLRVGYKGGSLGVNEETDSLCSRVDAISRTNKTEYLDVALSDKLVNYGGNRLLAKSASLDIEVKQAGLFNSTKAKVEVTALLGGVAKGTFNLIQGSGNSTPNTFYCSVGDTKNCQWNIAAPVDSDGKPLYYFDTLRLKAVSAGFSLEGGSDATQTTNPDANAKPTTFALVSEVDKELSCADPTLVTGSTTVKYVGNADGPECGSFGAVLTSSDTEVRLLKSRSTDPSAQFMLDIDWKVQNDGDPSPTIPDTFIDFEIGDGVEETALAFCSVPAEASPGVLVRNETSQDLEIADFDAFDGDDINFPDFDEDSPEKEFACIDTRDDIAITASNITYTDRLFAIGDLRTFSR